MKALVALEKYVQKSKDEARPSADRSRQDAGLADQWVRLLHPLTYLIPTILKPKMDGRYGA